LTSLRWAAVALVGASACAVTPLTNKLTPGEDAFVVVIGEGPGGETDLFAANTAGGPFVRFTFTRRAERLARLAPGGTAVAFLRDRTDRDTTTLDLVVMNLLNASERRVEVPARFGQPTGLGWSGDGRRIYLRGAAGELGSDAPPAPMALAAVSSADRPSADSAVAELLGDPAYARVERCGLLVCLVTTDADTTLLPADTREAIRWTADSVALLRGDEIEIRPLGGGRLRRPTLADVPAGLRSLSHHAGAADTLR